MQRLGCPKVAIAAKISEEYVADKILHLLDLSLHFCLKSIGKADSRGLPFPLFLGGGALCWKHKDLTLI
jgi:hypothetical protein